MILRKSLLESELVRAEHSYEWLRKELKTATPDRIPSIEAMMQSIEFDVADILKELDLIKANER